MKHLTEEEIFNKLYEKGCFLLGQLFLDNDEIDYIINYTRNIIDLDENFINESADLILSVGLVIIAANDYQDGNYWGFLQLKLKIDKLSPLKQGIIGRKFLNTLEEYELFQLSKNENGMNRYVENIKAHAFVTDNYMNGYYDFLFDYYEKNLFRDISLEVEDTLQDLSDYMKTTLDQNDDIVYSNNLSDMKTKSYKLLKSTREVIAQCDGKSLLELFYTSLKIIDRNFYDGIIPNENEGRFAKGFINWNNNKQLSKEYKKDKESNLRNNNLKPYIEMHNGSEFYLIIPKRRFRMSSNGNISVNVAINGLILKNELEVSINMGTYISEEIKIPIEYPFGKIIINYSTIDVNEIILDNNSYIIFDENQHQINEFRNGINYVVIEKGNDFWIKNEESIQSIHELEEWVLYVLYVDDSFMCTINSIPLSVKGKLFFEPIYNDVIEEFSIYDYNKKLIVTRRHPFIIIKIKNSELNSATIKINNKNISLKNEKIEILTLSDNENMSTIKIDFNQFLSLVDENIYNIQLNFINGKNKVLANYLLLKDFNISFDKKIYINEKTAMLFIKSKNKSVVVENSDYIKYVDNDINNGRIYKIALNENYQEVIGILNIQRRRYIIKIPINMVLYGDSVENLKYYNKINEIWYKHLSEIGYIKINTAEKIGVYENSMLQNISWGDKIENGLYRINLSNIIRLIGNNEKNEYMFYLGYKTSKDEGNLELFSVFKIPNLNSCFDIKVENDILYFDYTLLKIKGMQIYYSVKKLGFGSNYIIENRKLISGRNYLPELKKAIQYEVVPFIEESDEFGMNKNKIQLNSIEFIVFSNDDEKNQYFCDIFADEIESKTLKINNIRYEDIELKIDLAYNYKVESIRYINGEYIGVLALEQYSYKDNETIQEYICNVKISNLAYKNKEISFYLESFSFKNGEKNFFYYDKKKKKILSKKQYMESINEYKMIIRLTNKTRFISWIDMERR